MFKDLLIQWVTELNEKFVSVGQNGYLAVGIGAFNPTLFSYIKSIMQGVAMPIAYSILSLFFVLELYRASVKVEGAGGGQTMGAEMIFKVMFRMVLCKVAVDSALLFMESIYNVGLEMTNGVAGVISNAAVTNGLDVSTLTSEINSMSLGEQIGLFSELLIVKFAVWIILGLVDIICIARFIEIYVYVAVSPIPLATFPGDEMSAIGKNFLKGFAAISLQGALIYIVLSIFPMLFNSDILGDTSIWGILLYCIILALGVFNSNRWAKSICNAM